MNGAYLNDFPFPYMLYDGYKTRDQAIRKCALFAQLRGHEMFAIQDGGMCLTSPSASKRYNKYGESQDCKRDGKGGPRDNQVYRLPERRGTFMFSDFDILHTAEAPVSRHPREAEKVSATGAGLLYRFCMS